MTVDQSNDQLRATLNLCLAQLEAGRSTHQAAMGAARASHQWGMRHIEVVPLGRAVMVQHKPKGEDASTLVDTVSSLDGFNCEHMKQLNRCWASVLASLSAWPSHGCRWEMWETPAPCPCFPSRAFCCLPAGFAGQRHVELWRP